jgi:ribonuclease R
MQMIQGRTDAHMIQTVMLRSMRQAMYQVENHGHFGLGYEAYTHFTSPIRRYPDLLVHRAIRSVIRSDKPTAHVRRVSSAKPLPLRKIYPYSLSDMLMFGEQCSRTERRADEATRDVVSWLKCEFLRDRVGDVFEGHVSSVTSFGLFVELNDLYVEGLVHITSLPHDYYRFEPAMHRLIGERTRKVFGLGDDLLVKVVGVDLDNRKIDFELESVVSHKQNTTKPIKTPAKKAKTGKELSKEKSKPGNKTTNKVTAKKPGKKPVSKKTITGGDTSGVKVKKTTNKSTAAPIQSVTSKKAKTDNVVTKKKSVSAKKVAKSNAKSPRRTAVDD